MIHGSAIGTAVAGTVRAFDDQTMLDGLKFLLVASSKLYVFAPRTGVQANDGVRGNSCRACSSTRSRKAFSPCGPRWMPAPSTCA